MPIKGSNPQENIFSEKANFLQQSRFTRFNLTFPFFIAPMVGLSHVAFRELIKAYTPKNLHAIRFTEMLSTRQIPNQKLDSSHMLKCAPNESFFIPQLLGNEEKYIAPSIEKLMNKKPFGFDINMGCPVSHTLKHNWGVRLMGDIPYASEVVKITKKHSPVPVSVKMRCGHDKDEDEQFLFSFTAALEQSGADFITIHGRTRAQKHSGEANWGLVSRAREKLSIPVIANGNIQTSTDALSVIKDFSCDGAMIARAACARPWILWQISEDLGNHVTPEGYENQKAPRTSEEEAKEYGIACLKFISILKNYFIGDEYVLERFRFFAATGAKWLQFGHFFWKTAMQSKSVVELETNVENFISKYENCFYERVNMI